MSNLKRLKQLCGDAPSQSNFVLKCPKVRSLMQYEMCARMCVTSVYVVLSRAQETMTPFKWLSESVCLAPSLAVSSDMVLSPLAHQCLN